MSLKVPTQRLPAHTHIRKKEELVALSKRRAKPASSIVAAINLSHRFARGILKMSIKPGEGRERGMGGIETRNGQFGPFIQTSSLQHCYYNAHKRDRYAARNCSGAIVTSQRSSSKLVLIHLS